MKLSSAQWRPFCSGLSVFWNNNLRKSVFILQASERESYSQTELLSDLANCHARVVHVIVDQSYAGDLAREVNRSPHHQNIVVYASSRDHEYSWGSDFTDLWANTNHTQQCAQHVHRVRNIEMKLSAKPHRKFHIPEVKVQILTVRCVI